MNYYDLDIFEKVCSLKVRDIRLCTSIPSDNFDLLAFVIGSGDIILYCLQHDSNAPIIRWLPWFDDVKKKIHCLVLSPNIGQWLLVVCNDSSLYILPALLLLNLASTVCKDYHEWDKYDITNIPSPVITHLEFVPTSVAWWIRKSYSTAYNNELRDVGILGSANGHIIIFALSSGNIIVTTKVEGPVCSIEVCDQEPNACVIITNDIGRQWRLLFHESIREQPEQPKLNISEPRSSKLLGLKQLSVDTIANIKQRISETRSKSISTVLPVECTEGDVVRCAAMWQLNVKLQSVGESTLAVHNKIITASYPANIVAVENFQAESTTVHKLPFPSYHLIITESLFLLANQECTLIYIISQAISQCRTDCNKHILNTEFNMESIIQELSFQENEHIIKLYCTNYYKHRCIAVTNSGIYTLKMKDHPHSTVLTKILSSEAFVHLAEKISCVFGLEVQQLIREAADIQLTNGNISQAIQLYNLSRSGAIRSIVMLAKYGHVTELMSAFRMSNFTHSHMTNLKVLVYVYQYLTHESEELHQDFLEMLNKGGYDESLCVSVLAQAGLCEDLLLITNLRGLQPVTVVALANILQRNYPLNISRCNGFWDLMSDHSLCEALLAKPQIAKVHLNFIQSRLNGLSEETLYKFERLYNPFRSSMKPWISSTCQGDVPISLWVQTYLLICIHISARNKSYNFKVIEEVFCNKVSEESSRNGQGNVVGQVIGAGFSHASVILHGNLYIWGTTASGCLGTGPSYSRVMSPTIVDMFPSIGVRVLSVSCGRTHTVALTNNGVYAWGSNRYGQLGIGNVLQSWFPRLIEYFVGHNIINISCGQYHSIAVNDKQEVFTWGWGVHGQLGHGNVEDYYEPKLIELLLGKEIVSSSGGHAHTLFLDIMGKVWACGSSVFGQLGTGANIKSSIPLQVFGLPEKIVNLSTGYFHSVGLAEGGRVYQWGCSPTVLRAAAHAAKRRLRIHDSSDDCAVQMDDNLSYLSPTLVDTSHVTGTIVKVSVGNEHNALLTDDGTVFTWGRNMDGQLGNTASQSQRRSQHILHPTPITVGTDVKDVECGADFTIAIDTTGKVWTWGANHHSVANLSALASLEGEVVVVKNRSRVIKLPHGGTNSQPLPTLLAIPTQHNELPPLFNDKLLRTESLDREARMYSAIEILHPFYQPAALIDKCIELGESNAGAKLAQVNGDIMMAIKLHLNSASNLDYICDVLYHYLPNVNPNSQDVEKILEIILDCWLERKLDIEIFEVIMNKHWDRVAKPLGHLLFRVNGGMAGIFPKFSTEFGLRLVSYMLSHDDGNLECVLPGVENIKDAVSAINMSDKYIDIDENMAYESVPYKVNLSDPVYSTNQGLRKPSLYLK